MALETSRLRTATDRTDSVRQRFEEIDRLLEELGQQKARYELSVQLPEERDIAARAERTYQVLKNDLQQVKNELDDLRRELATAEEHFDAKEREFLATSARAFFVTLKDRLGRSQRVYGEFKEFAKKKVARQIRNLDMDGELSDQQVERLAEEDPDALGLMVQRKIYGKASLQMQYAAQDVVEKCEAIRKLQRNVRELVEMLKEISQIVFEQGERVDTIAEYVGQAKDHVGQATRNLVQAKDYHESARCVP